MRTATAPFLEPHAQPRRRLGRLCLLAALGLAIAPFAVDLFSLARVNWELMSGVPYPHAATPTIDWAADLVDSARRGAWVAFGRNLHDAPLKPAHTIAFATAWAFAAGLLLRGGARR
jgi:hypothetical protein